MGTVAPPRPDVLSPSTQAPSSMPAPRTEEPPAAWPVWQRVLFRFFFIYLVLQIEPWDWFRAIPGVPWLLRRVARAGTRSGRRSLRLEPIAQLFEPSAELRLHRLLRHDQHPRGGERRRGDGTPHRPA